VTDLRRAIAELDPQAPVYEIHSARALVDRSLVNFVIERRREIGVRMALGAQAGEVLRLVLGKGMCLALLGGAFGLAGGMAVAPLLTSAAPELPAHDPTGVAALAVLLVAVALFACWLPARRAAALDPMVALRQD
jgi:ABC-type antimicrobial peptide transport system permease subunit